MGLTILPAEIIKRTRDQIPLSAEEITTFISHYTNGEIPDYQMSAWLMAVVCKGLTEAETLALTGAMLHSGSTLNLEHINKKKVDKHSTGGIGDKTSLILGPIVAAAGVAVPMMSGRGLGHTGGTLDKLESIPGFNTQISLSAFESLLSEFGIGFIGQTKEICPADKKIYALRDVTGTVESLPLISASIMSKKLAEDLDGLVLDVKFGTGAFMKTLDSARALAQSLSRIGQGAGKKVTAILSNMNQPLGAFIGNALEIRECLDILSNKTCLNKNNVDLYADTRSLSLSLAGHMIYLSGRCKTLPEAGALAEEILRSGEALRVFEAVCRAQGGDLQKLPEAQHQLDVLADQEGYINNFDGERIGLLGIQLGAGRATVSDTIEPTSGFKIHHKIGESIKKGDVLWTLFGPNKEALEKIQSELIKAVLIRPTPPPHFELIKEIIFSQKFN